MQHDICPRCHEAIRRGALWTPLAAMAGRGRVFQVRHRKADGRGCVAYVGGRAGAVPIARPDYRASVFAAVAALGRRAG